MRKEYIFKHDPGHGWLLVPYADIAALGIKNKITPYSYLLHGHAWLEEDLDAGTFLDAAKASSCICFILLLIISFFMFIFIVPPSLSYF